MYLNSLVILQSTVDYTAKLSPPSATDFFIQAVLFIIAFIFVIILAFYSTRWVATAKFLKQGNDNVQLIERVSVSQQNSVQLIRVGGKYVLIGVSKDRVSFLTEVDKDEIMLKESIELTSRIPFESVLKQIIGKKKSD